MVAGGREENITLLSQLPYNTTTLFHCRLYFSHIIAVDRNALISNNLLPASVSHTRNTTETGRLFFRRRTKQSLLSRNVFELSPRALQLTPNRYAHVITFLRVPEATQKSHGNNGLFLSKNGRFFPWEKHRR